MCRPTINAIIGKDFQPDAELLGYMEASETEAALRFFETDQPWTVPAYIEAAIG
jgi:hypothetical protein